MLIACGYFGARCVEDIAVTIEIGALLCVSGARGAENPSHRVGFASYNKEQGVRVKLKRLKRLHSRSFQCK